MFSTANAIPVSASRSAIPSTKPRTYSRCQRNGGCTTTVVAPSSIAISALRRSFAPGLGPPHPLHDQQARRVDGADRHLVPLDQPLDGRDVLARQVETDHDLHGVVAQGRRRLERTRRRLGVDRCSRQRDASRRHSDRRLPGHRVRSRPARSIARRASSVGEGVERLQDHAFAQRPGTDLQLPRCRRGPSPPPPPDRRRPADARDPRRPPAAWPAPSRVSLASFGSCLDERRPVSVRRTYGPSDEGGAPQTRASDRNVFDVATAWSSRAAAQDGPRATGDLRPDVLPQVAVLGVQRDLAPQPLPGQPAGAQLEGQHHVGHLVGAGGDLERAAADVEDGQPARRPAEPAPYGEERQLRLLAHR